MMLRHLNHQLTTFIWKNMQTLTLDKNYISEKWWSTYYIKIWYFTIWPTYTTVS
jgi:hypothetical protein